MARSTNPKKRKNSAEDGWNEIRKQSKIVICSQPEGQILVKHADDQFISNFGFETFFGGKDCCGCDFSQLGASPAAFNTINDGLLTGSDLCLYVNLSKDNGVHISCHVTLVPISPATSTTTSWGVLTIRSASSVGNAQCFGFPLAANKLNEELKKKALRDLTGSVHSKGAKHDVNGAPLREKKQEKPS